MDANGIAATRAFVFPLLVRYEFADAVFFNIDKVFRETHAISVDVLLIHMFQIPAREGRALETEFDFILT